MIFRLYSVFRLLTLWTLFNKEIRCYKSSVRITIKEHICSDIFSSDAAKSENKREDMTVYSVLESNASLTVKFRINPVSNYSVYWSMDGPVLQDTHVVDIVKEEYVQTTCYILNVTQDQLGNYNVRVINWAISGEQNIVTFNVKLKLPGKKINTLFLYSYNQMLPYL